MKCPRCGKEMEKIGSLTLDEQESLALINKKLENVMQALNPVTIREMQFTDGQVFEYFRAVFDSKAQAEFLRFIFFRDLAKRLNINTDTQIQIGDGSPDNVDIYIHKHTDIRKE